MKFAADFSKGILGNPDSEQLWTDIISKIPDSVLLKPNIKILFVACGHSTEAVLLARRMMLLGVSKEAIQESFWLIDKYRVFTNPAKFIYGFKNVVTEDYLEWNVDMKFDVMLGNPPFQAPKKGDYSYWARFVDKSHKLLNDDGYLAMIIPAGWMSPTNDIRQGQRSVMRDIFAKENTFYINLDPNLGKNHFPGVGQTFTWFAMQKGQYKHTEIDFGDSQVTVDLRDMPMLAKETNSTNIEIIKKICAFPTKWNFVRYIMSETWDDVSFQLTTDFPHARINGNSNHLDKIVYTKDPCRYQKQRKVVLPYNGSQYRFVVDSGKDGGTNAYVMLLESTDLIKSAETYFNSKLVSWIGKNKFTQYNEGALINSISAMDLSHNITEDDIYKFYKLTDEERKYIEDNA